MPRDFPPDFAAKMIALRDLAEALAGQVYVLPSIRLGRALSWQQEIVIADVQVMLCPADQDAQVRAMTALAFMTRPGPIRAYPTSVHFQWIFRGIPVYLPVPYAVAEAYLGIPIERPAVDDQAKEIAR